MYVKNAEHDTISNISNNKFEVILTVHHR